MTPTLENLEMQQLADTAPDKLVPFGEGDVVEATVISQNKHKLIVDVAGIALGMVPEREFSYDVDDLNVGDKVTGYVLLPENRDGFVILSLKRADKERVWKTLAEKQESGEPLKVKISSANRGGLLVEFGGIEGFIPVSQLSSGHYSKQDSTDPSKTTQKLRQLIGETLRVKVITIDKQNNKLIFSEKQAGDEASEKKASSVKVGTIFNGSVTGIVDFGLFVKVNTETEGEMEGLVHISEVSWDRVEDLTKIYSIGQQVEVMVISNDGGRLSFSIKRLTNDPWSEVEKKYSKGDVVKGEITRVTPFGAFVKLNGNLDALVHISELGENISDAKAVVAEGTAYDFTILSVDAAARKISLSLKDKKPAAKKTAESAKKTKTEEAPVEVKEEKSKVEESKAEKPKPEKPVKTVKKATATKTKK